MYEQLLKLYYMAIAGDVRSPMPHLIGPPGCGKSTVIEQLASDLGKQLRIINVARLSPLEVEGAQMPHGSDEAMRLRLLHATYWTDLEDGDILFFDEFLRGFPEVYNGLLDIFTSRQVGGLKLPKVFIIGASNSMATYDKALDDRLLHLPVPDPRKHKAERRRLAEIIVDQLGLMPMMAASSEMERLLDVNVLPMFDVLDQMKGNGNNGAPTYREGKSIRNLIGQAQLREIQTAELEHLLTINNSHAMSKDKVQYVLLSKGKSAPTGYEAKALKLVGNDKLTKVQAMNLHLNLQLIEMEKIRQVKGIKDDDNDEDIFEPVP